MVKIFRIQKFSCSSTVGIEESGAVEFFTDLGFSAQPAESADTSGKTAAKTFIKERNTSGDFYLACIYGIKGKKCQFFQV